MLSAADAAELTVFTSGGPVSVERQVFAAFTDKTGMPVRVTLSNLQDIQERLDAGATPDLVIMPQPALAGLASRGRLLDGSSVDLAQVGIGVIVAANAAGFDVSTVPALRAALLATPSLVYPDPKGGGFTGAHIERVIAEMGISAALRRKTTYLFAIRGGVSAVASGAAAMGLFNISEVLDSSDIRLVGPFPNAVQNKIVFSGAVFRDSASPEAARALLGSLLLPENARLWEAAGFEPSR